MAPDDLRPGAVGATCRPAFIVAPYRIRRSAHSDRPGGSSRDAPTAGRADLQPQEVRRRWVPAARGRGSRRRVLSTDDRRSSDGRGRRSGDDTRRRMGNERVEMGDPSVLFVVLAAGLGGSTRSVATVLAHLARTRSTACSRPTARQVHRPRARTAARGRRSSRYHRAPEELRRWSRVQAAWQTRHVAAGEPPGNGHPRERP